MRLTSVSKETVHRVEWLVALGVLCIIVVLHITFMVRAGALWRDEAGTFNHATLPGIRSVVAALDYDPFPIFPILALRAWASMPFCETDAGLRAFGFLVGILILMALWWNARSFGYNVPLIAMVLIGLNPTFFKVADSVRPYGLGILFTVISFRAFWLVSIAPTGRRMALAAMSGVVMAHCLYPNSILLPAIAFGAIMVCMHKKVWSRAFLIGAVGLLIALTLTPYIPIIERAALWVDVQRQHNTSSATIPAVLDAFGTAGRAWIAIWLITVSAAFVASHTLSKQAENSSPASHSEDQSTVVFVLSILVVSATAYVVFLESVVSMPLRARHVFPLLTLTALCVDVLLGRWRNGAWLRIALAVAVVIGMSVGSWKAASVRQTTIDIAAAIVAKYAEDNDFVIVCPWYMGPSFDRYYNGNATWSTIPPIEDKKMQRFDLLRQRMMEPNPMAVPLTQMARTLEKGHSVWVIGELPELPPHTKVRALPPAPHPESGWYCEPYVQYWGLLTSSLLRSLAKERKEILLDSSDSTNPDESPMIQVFMGKKGNQLGFGSR